MAMRKLMLLTLAASALAFAVEVALVDPVAAPTCGSQCKTKTTKVIPSTQGTVNGSIKSNNLQAGTKQSLNPQPLPPGSKSPLNPQPLPSGGGRLDAGGTCHGMCDNIKIRSK
jgi:hypothetical protein